MIVIEKYSLINQYITQYLNNGDLDEDEDKLNKKIIFISKVINLIYWYYTRRKI